MGQSGYKFESRLSTLDVGSGAIWVDAIVIN